MTNAMMAAVVTRHLEAVVPTLLAEEAVLILNGARTVGKSTLMRACADAAGVGVHDLDDVDVRAAVAADPNLFVRQATSPVCFDEFQHVLPVLDAIKAELNKDLRPGRFMLTGSTRYSTLPTASQSLTGRAHVLTMWPFSQGELRGTRETFLDQVLSDPADLVSAKPGATVRAEYEQMVLAGGFPLALQRPAGPSRNRWYTGYVNMVVERDVLEIRKVRQREVLPQVLRRLAAQTAQVLNLARVAESLELNKVTVNDFVSLLEAVFLVHRLSAYGRTLSTRVSTSPKVHLVDTGLGAHLMGLTQARLAARDPASLAEFGHLLETFAVNEIIKQAGWSEAMPRFGHFRTSEGHEVDLVIEGDDGRVVGVEVKAAGQVPGAEFRGLRMLRDKLGHQFIGGVVLYLGGRSYTYDERLHVLPMETLWTATRR
jgi:predicted AAA+ superfamily ATPase